MQRCNACGGLIDPVPKDGTDPEAIDGSWQEVYECQRCGRTGKLIVEQPTEENGWRRSQRRTGVLRNAEV